ncbi:TPA: 3-phosphoshikimate 1-carboxyvinyltransferase [bacterium]|nr:3-phosphoshikimate 1-carboxyvinyltransferase [bacterium]
MKIKIYPSKVKGVIKAPPSKSYLHRVIISAALSNGESLINNVSLNDDVTMTINALKKLGASITYSKNTLKIMGIEPKLHMFDYLEIDCNQSGSTLRFLIPLCSYLSKKTKFIGKESLFIRPLDEYEKLFKKNNLIFDLKPDSLLVEGPLISNQYELSIDKSSQFLTGLLFLTPLLNIDTNIKFTNSNNNSISFVKMTLEILSYFGIKYLIQDNLIKILGNQEFKAGNYHIEGDYSLSAFYLLLGLTNGEITITDLNLNSIQGDKAILDIIKLSNGDISIKSNSISTRLSKITSFNYSLADCIDLGPLLSVYALFGNDETRLLDASNLKLKESDRVNAIINELKKVGAQILFENDTLIIRPSKLIEKDNLFYAHEDHRIAFALTLLALNLKNPSVIEGIECVNKSYSDFLIDIKKIGINYELID